MASWRPLNRFEIETPDAEQASTSVRKLSQKDFEDVEVQEGFGYRIVNVLAVFSAIFKAVVCRKCKLDVTVSAQCVVWGSK